MYGLPDCVEILENTTTKTTWRTTVYNAVCRYWTDRLQSVIPLYPSLKWLEFNPGQQTKRHHFIESTGGLRDVSPIAVQLKIVTGTYILQTNRVAFKQNYWTKRASCVSQVKRLLAISCWIVKF